MMPFVLLVSACEPPPGQRQMVPTADPDNGRRVIQRLGCGACHRIDGIGWPQGVLAPRISAMQDRGLIAGRLPNNPETLARFVRDAPSLVPGTPMPAMPMSEQEARDVAAYLYGPAK